MTVFKCNYLSLTSHLTFNQSTTETPLSTTGYIVLELPIQSLKQGTVKIIILAIIMELLDICTCVCEKNISRLTAVQKEYLILRDKKPDMEAQISLLQEKVYVEGI